MSECKTSEAVKRANTKYRSKNPDKVSEWNQTYYEEHKEEVKRKRRERYLRSKLNTPVQ